MPKSPMTLVEKVKSALHREDKGKRSLSKSGGDLENVSTEGGQSGRSPEASDLTNKDSKKTLQSASVDGHIDKENSTASTENSSKPRSAGKDNEIDKNSSNNATHSSNPADPVHNENVEGNVMGDMIDIPKFAFSVEDLSTTEPIKSKSDTEIIKARESGSESSTKTITPAATRYGKIHDRTPRAAVKEGIVAKAQSPSPFISSQTSREDFAGPSTSSSTPVEVGSKEKAPISVDGSGESSGRAPLYDSSPSVQILRRTQGNRPASWTGSQQYFKALSGNHESTFFGNRRPGKSVAGPSANNGDHELSAIVAQSYDEGRLAGLNLTTANDAARNLQGANSCGRILDTGYMADIPHTDGPPSDITEPFPALYNLDANGLVILSPSDLNLIKEEARASAQKAALRQQLVVVGDSTSSINVTQIPAIPQAFISSSSRGVARVNEIEGAGNGSVEDTDASKKENVTSSTGATESESAVTSRLDKGKAVVRYGPSERASPIAKQMSDTKKPLIGGFKHGSYKEHVSQAESSKRPSGSRVMSSALPQPVSENDRLLQSAYECLYMFGVPRYPPGRNLDIETGGPSSANSGPSKRGSAINIDTKNTSASGSGTTRPSYQHSTSSADAKKTCSGKPESQIPRRRKKTIPDAAKHLPSKFSALSDAINVSNRKAKRNTLVDGDFIVVDSSTQSEPDVGTGIDQSTQTDDTLPEKDVPREGS